MDVFNAFKGIEDDIAEAIEGTMPRQATVVRPGDNGGVWVRFTPVDTSTPEMWFPSTVAGLPAGTSGWVHPLAGGKGRFIADNVALPVPIAPKSSESGPLSISVSTVTTAIITQAMVLFTGLDPNQTYTVKGDSDLRAGNAGRLWLAFEARGETNVEAGGRPGTLSGAETAMSMSATVSVRPDESGEIRVYPVYIWASGSFTITRAAITATIY